MKISPRASNAIELVVEDAFGKPHIILELHEDGDGGLSVLTKDRKNVKVIAEEGGIVDYKFKIQPLKWIEGKRK